MNFLRGAQVQVHTLDETPIRIDSITVEAG